MISFWNSLFFNKKPWNVTTEAESICALTTQYLESSFEKLIYALWSKNNKKRMEILSSWLCRRGIAKYRNCRILKNYCVFFCFNRTINSLRFLVNNLSELGNFNLALGFIQKKTFYNKFQFTKLFVNNFQFNVSDFIGSINCIPTFGQSWFRDLTKAKFKNMFTVLSCAMFIKKSS